MTMTIKIIETVETAELSIIDPKTGIDWTADLLGNHNALVYDNDNSWYIMSQDDFNWWDTLIRDYQAADNRSHQIKTEMSRERRDEFERELAFVDCDLEDLPLHIQYICDKFSR